MQKSAYWCRNTYAGNRSLIKTLLVMKLTMVLLITAFLNVSARGLSQNIYMEGNRIPLKEIFKRIEKQTDYYVLYPKGLLDNTSPATVSAQNIPLTDFLTMLLKDRPLQYDIRNKTIFLSAVKSYPRLENLSLFPITGTVKNPDGQPLAGATIRVKGKSVSTFTNEQGVFNLNADNGDILLISFIGFNIREHKINGLGPVNLTLEMTEHTMDTTEIIINTGYQQIPKERSTGSFEFISNEELNRRVGPDILSRLEGVSAAVLFDRRALSPNENTVSAQNIIIRGLSTLTSTPPTVKTPLVVVNNFPYEGDINNINPNDVESISILKDAAAASIWGARAANGVIVITTKQGKFNQPFRLSVNASVNFTEKPDLFKYSKMSSADYIEVETFLFNKGFYNGDLTALNYPAATPAVEILARRRANQITSIDSAKQIDALKGLDVRNDFEKYVYRKSANQQYNISITGGGQKIKYFLSTGLDKNMSILKGDDYSRLSVRSEAVINPVDKLSVQFSFAFTDGVSNSNSLGNIGAEKYRYSSESSSRDLYPYARFADDNGNFLNIVKDYRSGYTDTAGAGKLLNWKFSPLQELTEGNNKTHLQDLSLNTAINYSITKSLNFQFAYQYQHSDIDQDDIRSEQTFYTRNLINLYTQIQGQNVKYIVPRGAVVYSVLSNSVAQVGRTQLNFNRNIEGKHEITSLAGFEIRERKFNVLADRTYGYNEKILSTGLVDNLNPYPRYGNRGNATIADGKAYVDNTDHLVSYYANAAYTYNKKYTFSLSGRKDASNLVGVDVSNRWKPFWTMGGSWVISSEPFFQTKKVDFLSLRTSFGYNGNINNTISPDAIISYQSASFSVANIPFATISQVANPGLSWEYIGQLNIGLDFRILRNRITGSLDLYRKSSNNIILNSLLDPTTGVGGISRNSASIATRGIELDIRTTNINGIFKWVTEFAISHVNNKVTDYKLDDKVRSASTATSPTTGSINPVRNSSPYPVYSLPFAGLDPANGDPQGYLGKVVSKDYLALLNQRMDTATLIYHGSAIPTVFGFFNNSFFYKGFTLTASVGYKLNYYTRKSTINYYSLFNNGIKHIDYTRRWLVPGDEQNTTVPSMVYPLSNNRRDDFYQRSSANVIKADHIRLMNIKLSYDLHKRSASRLPFSNIQVYAVMSNLGILWAANNHDIDPEYDSGNAAYPIPKTIAAGIKIEF